MTKHDVKTGRQSTDKGGAIERFAKEAHSSVLMWLKAVTTVQFTVLLSVVPHSGNIPGNPNIFSARPSLPTPHPCVAAPSCPYAPSQAPPALLHLPSSHSSWFSLCDRYGHVHPQSP